MHGETAADFEQAAAASGSMVRSGILSASELSKASAWFVVVFAFTDFAKANLAFEVLSFFVFFGDELPEFLAAVLRGEACARGESAIRDLRSLQQEKTLTKRCDGELGSEDAHVECQ